MFHVSLLEQNIIKKKRVNNQANKALPEPKKDLEFEARDNKKYEIKTISSSMVYNQ